MKLMNRSGSGKDFSAVEVLLTVMTSEHAPILTVDMEMREQRGFCVVIRHASRIRTMPDPGYLGYAPNLALRDHAIPNRVDCDIRHQDADYRQLPRS